ncbi:hypothetical protein [Amycolatopsis arida]|uniref:hypothetical protein n=1 Tax=Amycolatopsis arida TaxID=587909 RepID=UPI001065E96C|nr:hypothetical protein [Amycolatopsis arida]
MRHVWMAGGHPAHPAPVVELVSGAWARRADLRLVDALHVELAARPRVPLVTTDHRLAWAFSIAEASGPAERR